ncbi:CC0125/CC1285 family lipoprotein [Parvularcula oceani]|uniref:CC0125/CC1285 family lipoprotein n=1 Tax=Parvularcula oceani TaxID=1247963 RepID=UPI0006922E96|nr:hypothetical protein [Parvularcula oceani]
MKTTLTLTAAFAMGLAGCASPTPYEPAAGPSDQTGYTSSQVDPNTYRVTFEGNAVTERETVETYLLYRAAQIAQNTGHPYFRFRTRDVEQQIDLDTYTTYETAPGLYGYGSPFGTYGFTGYNYYSTFPYGAGVGYTDTNITTDDSYEAQAVIEVYEDRPSEVNGILDTSDVIERLRPEIEFPGEDDEDGGIL